MKQILASMAIALLMGGCAPKPYWTLTDDTNPLVTSTSFQFRLAQGWTRTTDARTWERLQIDGEPRTILVETMTATCDSLDIQSITVIRRYHETAFPFLKKKSSANMLAPELADLYIADLRKRTGVERITVLSNKPGKIDGKPGFQLVAQAKTDAGLRIQFMAYGFADKTGFYLISYSAPYLYFFDRDLKTFMGVVNSFKQTKGAFDPPPEMPAWAKMFT